MNEPLMQPTALVTLAIIGAFVVVLTTVLQRTGKLSNATNRTLTRSGYMMIAISIILFIVAAFNTG